MQGLIRRPKHAGERPFLVIWEVTQACDLACLHCRANASPDPHPLALSERQGRKLLRNVAAFGRPYPLLVFTGGDPFKRADLCNLISYARALGLYCGVSPSATPLLTADNLRKVRQAGANSISLSLDGSYPLLHDRFRGVEGSFEWTERGVRAAQELGFHLQINSTLGRHNLHDLVDLATLVYRLRVTTWSLFLLVPTGRAKDQPSLTPDEVEAIFHFLVDLANFIPVKTTEGHHYKRVYLMRQVLAQKGGLSPTQTHPLYLQLSKAWKKRVALLSLMPRQAAARRPMHVNAGQGFVFINQFGEVCPSGFLPLSAGNLRKRSLLDIYSNSPLFRRLRQPSALLGRCGQCEFKDLCGGSRSRAYAAFCDALATDPSCAYQPGSFPYPEELKSTLARSHFVTQDGLQTNSVQA